MKKWVKPTRKSTAEDIGVAEGTKPESIAKAKARVIDLSANTSVPYRGEEVFAKAA